MWLKVLYISPCLKQISQFSLTMEPKGKQWIVKFFEGDVCHHWKTGRQGVVLAAEGGNSHMTILFDDGYEEERRKAAFIKGDSWKETWM